jgi:deoxycytidylate deaminase
MIVIGITGTFGSGCSFIVENFLSRDNFEYHSLSLVLREKYKEMYPMEDNPSRMTLQDFGDKIREENGSDFLAKQICDIIKVDDSKVHIVDSIRNPYEIEYLRSTYQRFYILGVNADIEVRWGRVERIYDGNRLAFDTDEKRDKEGEAEHCQQVEKCFELADYVISNNADASKGNRQYDLLRAQVDRFLKLVYREKLFPTEMETAMAMAQAATYRSSCLKRHVGAAIVDRTCCVVSTGFNEVPPENASCKDAYGICYRTKLRKEFKQQVQNITLDATKTEKISKYYQDNVKLMDYCRALHAEENAILNMVRNGSVSSISTAILYTTTFPCNLCANKIVSIGIKKVVYSSPYPMKEAKDTLKAGGVTIEPFIGITYHGYFKMEG